MDNGNGSYFSRSKALLTRDKGWWKVLLVMAIATFVPIAGPLGVFGYGLEWARLTAWGVDSSPKQKNVDVGGCIKSGWRGFLAVAGWLCIWGLLTSLLFDLSDSGAMLILVEILGLLVGVILIVCALRASIYQKASAGYQANRIRDMLKADFGGVVSIAIMQLLMGLVAGIVIGLVFLVILFPGFFRLFAAIGTSDYAYLDEYAFLRMLAGSITSSLVSFVVFMYIVSIIGSFVNLVSVTAVGLWMRQFNVAQWGRSEDPLPSGVAGLPQVSWQPGPQDPAWQDAPAAGRAPAGWQPDPWNPAQPGASTPAWQPPETWTPSGRPAAGQGQASGWQEPPPESAPEPKDGPGSAAFPGYSFEGYNQDEPGATQGDKPPADGENV